MYPNRLPPKGRCSTTLSILKSLLPFLLALATVLALAACADEGGDKKNEAGEEQVEETAQLNSSWHSSGCQVVTIQGFAVALFIV